MDMTTQGITAARAMPLRERMGKFQAKSTNPPSTPNNSLGASSDVKKTIRHFSPSPWGGKVNAFRPKASPNPYNDHKIRGNIENTQPTGSLKEKLAIFSPKKAVAAVVRRLSGSPKKA